jgi:hypothetical protein
VIKELARTRPKKISLYLILILTFSSFSAISSIQTASADVCAPDSSTTNGLTTDTFTATGSCTFTIPDGVSFMDILLVGGGGSGGSYGGGGGGGGGVMFKTSYAVTSGATLDLTVGIGGTAPTDASSIGVNGETTTFGTLNAPGGGGGGAGGENVGSNGKDGANGGGGGAPLYGAATSG